jgi:hypothetical protein
LIVTISSGISSGDLPPQRWFDFGGKSMFNLNGNLRGVGYKAYTGDRMVKGVVELSLFKTLFADITEEMTDWQGIKRSLKLTPWIGLGWSDLSGKNAALRDNYLIPSTVTDGIYREFGISLGDKMNFFRIDLITNNYSSKNLRFSFNFFR